jgi:hypothetical protein
MSTNSTYGLELEQLADLFAIGANEGHQMDDTCDDEAAAGLLRSQLNGVLPKDSIIVDSILMMMGRMGCDMRSLAGKSLAEVLFDPQSDVGLLQAVKDYSKKVSCSSMCATEAAVATSIYYAALASALVYHDKKITQYTYEALDESFALLIEKKWMEPALARLFSRARTICQQRQKDK